MYEIEATNAHPSTLLALEAMAWLHERENFTQILDMGCGNGILSITAATIWQANVTSVDISPNAISDTIAVIPPNVSINAFKSDGFKHPAIRQAAPYDLILCNLLAQWHINMANDIQNHLAKGGSVIASGVLLWQEEPLLAAFHSIGFEVIQKLSASEWLCYILRQTTVT